MHMEDVVRRLLKLDPGAQMAKMDRKSAYWMVPVHPQDRPLLGVQWEGTVYFNPLADGLARMDCRGTWGGALYHLWYRKS